MKNGREIATLQGHTDAVRDLAFSPDGQTLATASPDETVRLWSVATGQPITTLKAGGAALSVLFSPDGRTLAAGTGDRTARLWRVDTQREVATLQDADPRLWGTAGQLFSPDSRMIATVDGSHVKLWSTASGQAITTLEGHTAAIFCMAFAPDGRTLATGGQDGTVRLWSPTSEPAPVTGGPREVAGELPPVAGSPPGAERASWREAAALAGHTDAIYALAFSPDGRLLASGSQDTTARLWNVANHQALTTFSGHDGEALSVSFSLDGTSLTTMDRSVAVRRWDVGAGRDRATTIRGPSGVNAIAYAPVPLRGTGLLALGTSSGAVELWDPRGPRLRKTWRGPATSVDAVIFAPDGRRLAMAGDTAAGRAAWLWDPASGTLRQLLKGGGTNVQCLAFSPDGRLLATGSGDPDRRVRLWDAHTGQLRAILARMPSEVIALAFSLDGRRVGVSTRRLVMNPFPQPVGGAVTVWDLRRRWPVASVPTDASGLAFLPDGRSLVTRGAEDNALVRWNLAAHQARSILQPPSPGKEVVPRPRGALALSPDGKTLAAGSGSTLILWNLASGQPVATLKGHSGPVTEIAFAPDGGALASGSVDGTVRVWPAPGVPETHPLPVFARGGDRMVQLQWRPMPRAVAYQIYRASGVQGGSTRFVGTPSGVRAEPGSEPERLNAGRGTHAARRAPLNAWTRLTVRPIAGTVFTDRGPGLVNAKPLSYSVAPVFSDGREGPRIVLPATPILAPSGFMGTSINEGGHTGAAVYHPASREIVLSGSGRDFWNGADGGYFLCKPVTGDFQITVQRLSRPTATNAYAKAGLMIRESLEAGDRNVHLVATALQGVQWQCRPAAASETVDVNDQVISREAMKLPMLVRLTRLGNRIFAEYSTDQGKRFQSAGDPATFDSPLPATLYAGLAITAHNDGNPVEQISEARFRDVTIQPLFGASRRAVALRANSFLEADPFQIAAAGGDRRVQLHWQALPLAVAYRVYRGPARATRDQIRPLAAVTGTAFTDRSPGLVNGRAVTYAIAPIFREGKRRVEATPVRLEAKPLAPLPPGLQTRIPGWTAASINEGLLSGAVGRDAAGVITLRGAGQDFWNEADSGYFLNQPVSGDFQITTQLLSGPTASNEWAKAGLMIRESLAASARDAFLVATPEHGLVFQWRGPADQPKFDALNDGSVTAIGPAALRLPLTLRLTHRGNRITADYSTDGGRSFQPAGEPLTFDSPLPETLYAGLAISAHNEADAVEEQISEARFSGLKVQRLGGQ